MARGRFISESVAKDMRLNSLSIEAELVYLMTIPHLDRDGLIEGDTDLLFGTVCPKRRQFQDLMEYYIGEWVGVGLVTRYESSEGPVLWFRGFAKNQAGLRYDRESPSIFPPPPGYKRTKTGIVSVEVPEVAGEEVQPLPPVSDNPPQVTNNEFAALPEPSVILPEASDISTAQGQEQVEVKDQVQDQPKELNEDEEAQARDGIHQAWFDTYQAEMPEQLEQPIAALVIECGQEATIHGIVASSQAKQRTFKFIEKCARNYLPPPPTPENSNYTKNGNGKYSVDIPGVVAMPPAPVAAVPPLPPPMAHDDPWQVGLDELMRTLPPRAVELLAGSQLVTNGELAGVPFYRVVVMARQDSADWLNRQVGPAIRKKVASVVGHRVEIEIIAAEGELA